MNGTNSPSAASSKTLSDVSRLTYSNTQTNSGEFFGRIDTPWNVFVKGYVGGGGTNTGRMNDEDNVVVFGPVVAAYSNTLSPPSPPISSMAPESTMIGSAWKELKAESPTFGEISETKRLQSQVVTSASEHSCKACCIEG